MSEKAEVKPEVLPDLDDLLQCPVCYEIPSGQIFQCNEGHHVCGRCKARLDVCPVCRALFFGTRNYAMEELIANIRKLRAFKLGGKVTTGSISAESSTPALEVASDDTTNDNENDSVGQTSSGSLSRPPQACKGLFRCLVCKNTDSVRLPAGRMLNHLRYYHAPDLLEGQSENGEYVQAWQFPTTPGRIVIAVRVSDMGIFFLIIEICNDTVSAWLTMAASPWVAHEFCYTITISGNDREAIFSDCVWSVRSCEGTLKKRGHCLAVTGVDAQALTAPTTISGKLSLRHAPADSLAAQTQPRAVLRVASRGNPAARRDDVERELEPFLQDLQNDVARLSRAFATLGREANALARSEAQIRARFESVQGASDAADGPELADDAPGAGDAPGVGDTPVVDPATLSRNARRRLRRREAARAEQRAIAEGTAPRVNGLPRPLADTPAPTPTAAPQPTSAALAPAQDGGPSHDVTPDANPARTNKKKRRQRR